jgi:hypothetical protein
MPVLVIGRSDAASERVLDWSRRNKIVAKDVTPRYAGDLKTGELSWHAGAAVPALLYQGKTGWTWASGEQPVKDALWRLHQEAIKPPAVMTAYVSRNCGACAKFLAMLTKSPSLLAKTDLRILEDDPKSVLEMHDLGAVKTPAIVIRSPDGRSEVFQGASAMQRMIALS